MSFFAKRLEATMEHDGTGHSAELISLERFVVQAIKSRPANRPWPSIERERLVAELLERHSGMPKASSDRHLTTYQRDKIAQVPEAVAHLKRYSQRGVSISAVAVRIEVDRGTLTRWIAIGLVSLSD